MVAYPEGFEDLPYRMAGNTQSAHGVVFGKYQGEEVALKPFVRGQEPRECSIKANHEANMYQLVADLGYITLKPLDVVETDEAAFLITRYEPNIIPATTLSLGEIGSKDTDALFADPTEIVASMAKTLAHLHEDSITHGDAKPRNFSFHRISGIGPIVVDLEVAQDHRESGKKNQYFVDTLRSDMRSYAYSLGLQGFGGLNMKKALLIFDDVVLDPYHEVAKSPLPGSIISSARNALAEGRGVFYSPSFSK